MKHKKYRPNLLASDLLYIITITRLSASSFLCIPKKTRFGCLITEHLIRRELPPPVHAVDDLSVVVVPESILMLDMSYKCFQSQVF